MSAAPWIERPAPAKVNLFLEVLARRSDGYHELETLMLAISLADRVRVRRTRTRGVDCTLTGPFASVDVPRDERNLAVRAARTVLELARRNGVAEADDGLELELVKHVPSQAGLGGASSDAAAAFAAAETALSMPADEAFACAALAALGSDCVFFRKAATTGLARCSGRGEQVAPLPPAPSGLGLVLVTPDFGAPTALVYSKLTSPLSWAAERRSLLECFSSATSPATPWPAPLRCFNRLEDAACAALPALVGWRRVLRAVDGAHFALSGSGSSFFAVTASRDEAERLRQRVLAELHLAGLAPRGVWACEPAAPACA